MLKSAWILPVIMLAALFIAALLAPLDASAAEQQAPLKMPDTFYQDLPGVVPQEQRTERDDYHCTSEIADVYVGRGRYDTLFGDTEPRRIYHCETESGITYSGTQMPNTQWVPGLNPHHLPK